MDCCEKNETELSFQVISQNEFTERNGDHFLTFNSMKMYYRNQLTSLTEQWRQLQAWYWWNYENG